MPKVKQEAIDKAQQTIQDLIGSPSFPYGEDLLKSNSTLRNTIINIQAQTNGLPAKTLCGLLVDALEIQDSVTGEALWKRYSRVKSNRDGSSPNGDGLSSNRDTLETSSNPSVDKGYRESDANRDGLHVNGDTFGVNRDTNSLFIPSEITQTDLAIGLGEFFESKGYPRASLLKTCLMAIKEMQGETDTDNLKDTLASLCNELGISGDSSQSQ